MGTSSRPKPRPRSFRRASSPSLSQQRAEAPTPGCSKSRHTSHSLRTAVRRGEGQRSPAVLFQPTRSHSGSNREIIVSLDLIGDGESNSRLVVRLEPTCQLSHSSGVSAVVLRVQGRKGCAPSRRIHHTLPARDFHYYREVSHSLRIVRQELGDGRTHQGTNGGFLFVGTRAQGCDHLRVQPD